MGSEQLNRHKGRSGSHNTHNTESDEDSNLTAIFQDSQDSSIDLEREIWGAPRLPPHDADAINDQLNLELTMYNPLLHTGYYRRHTVVVTRQSEDLTTPVEDMHEETESKNKTIARWQC